MTICAVVGCRSSNDRRRITNPNNVIEFSFCRFPRDEKLRKVWLLKCGRDINCKAKRLFVCIRHFKPEDFMRNLRHELLNYFPKSSRKVKIDAVPSLFLPRNVPSLNTSDSVVENNEVVRNSAGLPAGPLQGFKTIPKEKQPIVVVMQPITEEQTVILGGPKRWLKFIPEPQYGFINANKELESTQYEFIDHVVMEYLNRCRSRAGTVNVAMPKYILKKKAQEAALLLGSQLQYRFQWIENFLKKIAENDKKGVDLRPISESLNMADIINEEWPKFAKQKEIDIGEDSEETLSALDEEEYTRMRTESLTLDQDFDQTQIKESQPDCSRSISPVMVMEEISTDDLSQNAQEENVTKSPQKSDASPFEFLKHVVLVFIRRFNATWPQVEIPETVLHAKLRDAAMVLGCQIKNRNVLLSEFKLSIKNASSSETILTEPNQSLEINDIIQEERTKFFLENNIPLAEGNELEECIAIETNTINTSEQNNVENCDTIQTYEEARDCLNLLNRYAFELRDFSALALIKQVDSFLRSENCEE